MTGAERMRRSRELQRRGAYHVDFVLAEDARMRLIEAGWLRRTDRDDKAAITAAVVACLTRTLCAQRGETEVPINKATAGRVKAPPAGEEGPGLSVARNGEETTPRPSQRPDKAAALAAYRDLLRGAELPDDSWPKRRLPILTRRERASWTSSQPSRRREVSAVGGESADRTLRRWQLSGISPQIGRRIWVPFLQLRSATVS